MAYRSPHPQRIAAQQHADIFRYGGYTCTWRDYLGSAAALSPAAGLGAKPLYTERTLTALFGTIYQPDAQTQAGIFAAASIQMTTREQMGRQDEIIWRGIKYSVDSDPSCDPLTSAWTCTLNRRKGS